MKDVEDCLECKITGVVTCLGISGYSLHTRMNVPETQVGHRRFLLGFSAMWAALALARGLVKTSSDNNK